VPEGSHSRFDAIARRYEYHIYRQKDPFKDDRAWFYPYPMDEEKLNKAASSILGEHDFTSFAKRRTQVYTHICRIDECYWKQSSEGWVFTIEGNRFLRGMVRALVATMVKVGRGNIDVNHFEYIRAAMDSKLADFSAPAHGLHLERVIFPEHLQQLFD
jgi:tRNA pseudouridine38-40 synthase